VQVSTSGDAVTLHRGGAVERLGRRGTPIDQQLIVFVIAKAKAADVQALAVVEIEPAET
jgi:hypothetical protein